MNASHALGPRSAFGKVCSRQCSTTTDSFTRFMLQTRHLLSWALLTVGGHVRVFKTVPLKSFPVVYTVPAKKNCGYNIFHTLMIFVNVHFLFAVKV